MKRILYILCICLLVCAGCTDDSSQAGDGTQQQMGSEMVSEMVGEEALESAQGELPEETDKEPDGEEISATRDVFAMDTFMTLTAYGANAEIAVEQAQARIEELDAMLSTGSPDSEVSLLNAGGQATLSEDTYYLLEQSIALCERTEGAFNPAIYPLMEAWGFPTKEYAVPGEDVIQDCLSKMNIADIVCDTATRSVEFDTDGMKVDFGGIAKGYTSSEIMDIFRENGIESGVVSLGGNVQTLGSKTDGSLWKVGIQDPEEEQSYLGVIEVQDKAVVTSGGYERYFEENGEIYHHIIDPATGYPAKSGLKSVTIVSGNGLLADALSTALFVMGLEQAESFWKENQDEFDAILVTDDNGVYVTEGIADTFSTGNMTVIEGE